jgi:hypothetical protein
MSKNQLFHKHATLYVSHLKSAVPNKTKLKDFLAETPSPFVISYKLKA